MISPSAFIQVKKVIGSATYGDYMGKHFAILGFPLLSCCVPRTGSGGKSF